MSKATRDDLYKFSIIDGKKIDDIAKIYNVSHTTISRWFKEYKIPSKYSIGDDYEILTGQYVKDKRVNDLDNLVTYCEECHLFKIHKYTCKQVEAIKDRRRLKFFK